MLASIFGFKLKYLRREKILKMHFKNVFYCSTLSAPISRCINVRHSAERKYFCIQRAQLFPFPPCSVEKFPLGRMHNENTPKLLQKQNSITGKKAFFVPCFILCGGSGNYRKKWPQDVLYISEWIIYGRHPSKRLRQILFCGDGGQHYRFFNTASNSFRKLPSSPAALWNILSTAEIMMMKQMVGKESGKHNGEHHLLQLFALLFLFVKQLLNFYYIEKFINYFCCF